MLILITGVPGSGKSLYSVKLINEYIDQNKKAVEKGELPRPIYSDIDGMNIEGVLPAPDDWRDCPDGSIVVYDECQQKFGPDGSGRSSRGDIQEFETHRHRGFDIILITQHPKLLHSHIRRLVGRHYHVERLFGSQNARIYQKDGQLDVDKQHQLLKADNFGWAYPKKFFGQYKSATVHTHKLHMPKFLKRFFIWILIFFAFLAFAFPLASDFLAPLFSEPEVIEESVDHSTPASDSIRKPEKLSSTNLASESSPVACIEMGSECVCYNRHGFRMDIPLQFCKRFISETPVFLDIRPSDSRRAAAS